MLDIEIAYDRLGLSFIKKCLTDLSLCDKWINWIVECITSITLTMVVNGKLDSVFPSERGIL